jgi:hypothetical protein
MQTRISESGSRRYLQRGEGHRDEPGKVRIKGVANLARLDKLSHGKPDPLINGLDRAVGRLENTASDVSQEFSRACGDVFAPHAAWKDLGFDRALSRALRLGRHEIDAEAPQLSRGPMALQRQLRAMVCDRLCAPDSKPGWPALAGDSGHEGDAQGVDPSAYSARHGCADGTCGCQRRRKSRPLWV